MNRISQRLCLILCGCISLLLVHLLAAPMSLAHWADVAMADIALDRSSAQIILTIPTGLVAIADDDHNGLLSPTEIRQHQADLQTQLGRVIELIDRGNQSGTLTVSAVESATTNQPVSLATTHSTLRLDYAWPHSIVNVTMRYRLFAPDAPAARCIATITTLSVNAPGLTNTNTPPPKTIRNVIFSPEHQSVALLNNSPIDWSKGMWATIIGAFIWGAAHATSPGHGKTLVGTYLIGERATAQHALFLGLTTTITHTLGVFTLGGFMLLASQSIVPEALLPWLSLLSGLMVVVIGGSLLRDRLRPVWQSRLNHAASLQHHLAHSHSHDHEHHDHEHHDHEHHDHEHHDHEHHDHEHHDHGPHSHAHLPPEGTPVSWRSLLALGVSGGLIPCPSALVLLLSAIAVGQVGYGLLLVLSFSLGLAVILTGLGLLLIYAKQIFVRLPMQKLQRLKWVAKVIPAGTALVITLIGVGISLQALISVQALGQIKLLPL
jgi:nickel/cobalt transporter (NicO) family protein